MTKLQIKLAWKKVIQETRNRSKLGERLKNKNISQLGDLLLLGQVLLGKIETGENNIINILVFNKTISFYCKQMKKYV